jgi:glycosyltransferase involved in cell wall biosynthesis
MKTALFGIGREAEKYYSFLDSIGQTPEYAFDNSPDRQGTFFHGIKIMPPDRIPGIDCDIIISCNFKEAITEQLSVMGCSNRIADLNKILRAAIEKYSEEYAIDKPVVPEKEESIVIDAFDGIGWGGMEIWSYEVGRELEARGFNVKIFGSLEQVHPDDEIEKMIIRCPLKRQDVFSTIDGITMELEKLIPFVLLDNWTEYVLYAAYILKKKYPEDVRIISIQHNDVQNLYEKKMLWEDQFEKISGVSQRINANLISKYAVDGNKIFYKENFLTFDKEYVPRARLEGKPLIIGWGARLEYYQKRADLIIPFIEAIERSGIDFVFNVAGNGPMYDEINDYVNSRSITDKVHVMGAIPQQQMGNFWKQQDIYLNLSDFEGCSLAMLEAMSLGCVPVVTNVSGTEAFIQDKDTGFCVNVGDVNAVVDRIAYLNNNPEEWRRFSDNAASIVREKCQKRDYVDCLEKIIALK